MSVRVCVCVCVCLIMIWYELTQKKWYAIKPNQSNKVKPRSTETIIFIPYEYFIAYLKLSA